MTAEGLFDELWEKIFLHCSWRERPKLEGVCRRWCQLMPYPDVDIECTSEHEAHKLLQWLQSLTQRKMVTCHRLHLTEANERTVLGLQALFPQTPLSLHYQNVWYGYLSWILREICRGTLPNLVSCHIMYISDVELAALERDVQLSSTFAANTQNLQSLKLFGAFCPQSMPPNLVSLKLLNVKIANLNVLLAPCEKLETLQICACDTEMATHMPLLPNLQEFDCGIKQEHTTLLLEKLGTQCPNLDTLLLRQAALDFENHIRLATLTALTCLEVTYFSGSLAHLINACGPRLRHLKIAIEFANNGEFFPGDALFRSLQQFANLESLSVMVNDSEFTGVTMTNALQSNTRLRCLHLQIERLCPLTLAPLVEASALTDIEVELNGQFDLNDLLEDMMKRACLLNRGGSQETSIRLHSHGGKLDKTQSWNQTSLLNMNGFSVTIIRTMQQVKLHALPNNIRRRSC